LGRRALGDLFNMDCRLPGDSTAAAGELLAEAMVADTPTK
jgi:hypothetical protein